MKKIGAKIFASLRCRKCKKRGDHVLVAIEKPEKENSASFECQNCGEIKRISLIEF